MGREIRRVPANWQHPTYADYGIEIKPDDHWRTPETHHPLHDENFDDAYAQWCKENNLWREGKHPDQERNPETTGKYPHFRQWNGGPPDPDYYRVGEWAFTEEEATHYQFYQNVSEGTPLSPVFATLEELEDWLVNSEGYSRQGAHAFCQSGWAPSMVFTPQHGIVTGVEAMGVLASEKHEANQDA